MKITVLPFLLVALVWLGACERTPEQKVQVQGTVTSVGFGLPVAGADVDIEWPAPLGGGSNTIKTDDEGHFVAGKIVRTRNLDCRGLVITVRAQGFASAYDNSTQDCSKGLLSTDFKMLPIPQ